MSVEEMISETMIEQGLMGVLLLFGIFLFKRMIEKLFILVENNTTAMTKNADAIHEMKTIIQKCEK